MAEKGFKRKLAAILSADVEGYSRLMGDGYCPHVNGLLCGVNNPYPAT
jgi:hypothetical protein